jgi:hypothetical protein
MNKSSRYITLNLNVHGNKKHQQSTPLVCCMALHNISEQGQRKAWNIPSPKNLIWWPWPVRKVKIIPCDFDLWPWKSIGFQILLRTKYVPSLVKIHWRMLILECSQGWYAVKSLLGDLDLWHMPWKSIGFQILLRTKYIPSLVKIHWRMLILECSQGYYTVKKLTRWPWPLTYDLENQ